MTSATLTRPVDDVATYGPVASHTVELTDVEGNEVTLTNCSFFSLKDLRSQRVFVSMSDGVNVLH